MQKHQDALLMRGTPNQRVAVAATAIVHVTTVKATISSMTEATSLVHDTIAKAAISRGKAAISHVHAIIAKAVICKGKAAIVLDIITGKKAISVAKVAISKGKVASSLALATIAKAAISRKKAAISPAIVMVTPPKGEPEGASVLTPLTTILMQSTA